MTGELADLALLVFAPPKLLLSIFAVLAIPSALLAQDPFYDYSSSLGGNVEEFTFCPLLKPAGVSPGIDGKSGEWLQGVAPTNADPGIRFSGNPSFPNDTTDFLDGGGIYTFFSLTHFRTTSTDPETGMLTLVLQVQMAGTFLAEPMLSVTTSQGSETLAATFSSLQSSEPGSIGDFAATIRVYGFQWDLSSIDSAITSYRMDWQVPEHSVLGGQKVSESTAAHAQSVLQGVPEPGSATLLCAGMMLLGWPRRARAQRAATR